jgi:DNA-binding protein YbaB
MNPEIDARPTEALEQLHQFVSVLEEEERRASTHSFSATDETGTVTAVVNGNRWLTGLRIEPGLLRLGANTVQQRIGEALSNAQTAALGDTEAQDQQFEESLAAIAKMMQQQLGDSPPNTE